MWAATTCTARGVLRAIEGGGDAWATLMGPMGAAVMKGMAALVPWRAEGVATTVPDIAKLRRTFVQ